mmetsp:Transcript_6491/g.18169  ORF Transcript_6491/g.18169 Transcript_6491/m.18169 type:complete len:346 (-) Transcript_6491:333-1370(-)
MLHVEPLLSVKQCLLQTVRIEIVGGFVCRLFESVMVQIHELVVVGAQDHNTGQQGKDQQRRCHRKQGAEADSAQLATEGGARPCDGARIHTPIWMYARVCTLWAVRHQPNHDGTEGTAHAVNAPHVQRVVKVSVFQEVDAGHAHWRRQEPEQKSRRRLNVPGCGRDGGKTRNGTDARGNDAGLTTLIPIQSAPHDHGRRGRDLRVPQSHRGHAVGRFRRARVEPKPTEPEHRGAQKDQRHAVHVVGIIVHSVRSPAEKRHRRQSGEACSGVDHDTSCKVDHAPLAECAVSPDQVTPRRIHHNEPHAEKDEPRHEPEAVSESAGHESWRDDGKFQLESGKEQAWNL